MDLLDASSGMFMMGLKVSPNYCKLWEWLYTPVLGGQLIWKSSVTYVIWYGYHSWKRQALMDRNNCCYQLSGLTIEFKNSWQLTSSFGIVSHENQQFHRTTLKAWLLSQVKIYGSLHLEIMPSFHVRLVFEGLLTWKFDCTAKHWPFIDAKPPV